MSDTIIYELAIKEKDWRQFKVSNEFNIPLKVKYNSDLGFLDIDDEGCVFFGTKDKEWYQKDIKTDLKVKDISKILLELQKEYNHRLIGSFNYTSIYVNAIKQGTVFLKDDRAIIYSFEIDPDHYPDNDHTPSVEIIVL